MSTYNDHGKVGKVITLANDKVIQWWRHNTTVRAPPTRVIVSIVIPERTNHVAVDLCNWNKTTLAWLVKVNKQIGYEKDTLSF